MPPRNKQAARQGMAPDDPRLPLKVRRLEAERQRIAGFLEREPRLEDPEFEAWEQTVWSLLNEIFGASEFILRVRRLTFRPYTYSVGRGPRWAREPGEDWRHSLREADKIIAEAVEEAGLPAPSPAPEPAQARRPVPNVVVNVHNENVFSPTVHITVAQLLERLDALPLSGAEKELAAEHLRELEAETQGQGRWPLIARSLESMKAIGKNVYKEIAVPLVVEYLKRESGLK